MAPLKSTHTPASARQCLYARSPAVSKFRGRVKVVFWVYSPSQAMASISWLTCRRFFWARAAAAAAAVCVGSSASASPGERATCGGENPAEQTTIITGATVLHWSRQSWCTGKHRHKYYCISVLHWARQSWCTGKHRHSITVYQYFTELDRADALVNTDTVLLYNSTSLS